MLGLFAAAAVILAGWVRLRLATTHPLALVHDARWQAFATMGMIGLALWLGVGVCGLAACACATLSVHARP